MVFLNDIKEEKDLIIRELKSMILQSDDPCNYDTNQLLKVYDYQQN